ncbi:MAG: sulfite exporter TauE/SafE family protein [Bacteroidia bacterium]|jgi:uncharacterized membrane protein YfcA|nr:sulfite exporter TauE/SafE family protein [Bacteroidales bacterium]NCD40667.1 sulfite exporter TauE/SafE family protein [Bacteroidia bacterium]MDD2322940.1 sulfite exporter TauE/SafE family protein [Bacteroidales bacterium]MDD3011629.1 sulfite exporter TauE/SafE family protein [Bacteroidales bacterium]MDD3961923.1 sulfite exporter TauE/SafE family protein [Bacteroidales bacterium]
MSIFEALALILAGLLVGFINTLAGGGSIISLSLLMFLGLPANLANATNRVGVLLQNIVAVTSFSQKKTIDFKKGIGLALPAFFGSLLGALVAIDLNKKVIETVIGIIMLLMLVFIVIKPIRWIKENPLLINKKVTLVQIILFFLIGFYGGFIQLGVGYFLIAGLVLNAGYDLVKANAIKVFIILIYTPITLVVFHLSGQINWAYGLTLGIGTMLGGFVASRLAIKKGAGFVRWVLIIVILLTVARSFGLINIDRLLHSIF